MKSKAFYHNRSTVRSHVLKELPYRAHIVYGMLALLAFLLMGRGIYLHTFHRQFLQKKGEMRYSRVITIPASRGRITDRQGQILAVSTSVKSIWAIPSDVEMSNDEAKKLALLLRMPVAELKKKFNVAERDFVYLKRQVPPDIAEKVVDLDIQGVYQTDAQARFYPRGEEVSHLVGWTDVDDRGREGIELAKESVLMGVPGSRRVIRDRRGQIIEDVASVKKPQQGKDIQLTIDSRLQFIAMRELQRAIEKHKAKAGGLVIVDAKTGALLAAANYPVFNPNNRVNLNRDAVRNRAFTDLFEPGSTMKPFAAAMALESGKYTPNSLIATGNGTLSIGPATVHDAHPGGTMTLSQVIQKSSNVGASKIVLSLPAEKFYKQLIGSGFGQLPRTGFPGETTGHLRPAKVWKPIEHATLSYGHGLAVSLLQLAQAYTIFSTDGKLMPIKIYKDEVDQPLADPNQVAVGESAIKETKKTIPRLPVQVIKPTTAQELRKMLELVTQPGGTATKARVIGYRVGGKTGTAHKLQGRHYINKYVSSFIGIAPISNPRLIIAVMIDEPGAGEYYGGTVAAPAFSEVMGQSLRTLGVMPDLSVMSQSADSIAAGQEEVVKESD
ncbi:MAG: penicillin-binding protein 2 [Pseudomonadota bacterium]